VVHLHFELLKVKLSVHLFKHHAVERIPALN